MSNIKNLISETGIPGWLQPKKRYRGSPYTEQTWDEVLTRLSGAEYLTNVCRDDHMPEYSQLLRFIHAKGNEKWLAEYHQARKVGTEIVVERGILMAAEGKDENGEEIMEDVQRSTLRVNSYKWVAAHWNKERYGETKQDVAVNINIGDAMDKARARSGITIEGKVDD